MTENKEWEPAADTFEDMQEAFARGDLEHITAHMREEALARATRRAEAVRALRDE